MSMPSTEQGVMAAPWLSSAVCGRVASVDVVKLVAMVMVMGLHAVFNHLNPIYAVSLAAMPLFFIVPGWLQLPRRVSARYCAVKMLRIIRFYVLMYVGIYVVRCINSRQWPDMEYFSFLLTTPYEGTGGFWIVGMVFWYLRSMLLVYCVLPVLSRLYWERPRVFVALTVLLLMVQNAAFATNVWHMLGADVPCEIEFVQELRLWQWLGYFCLGGLLRRYPLRGVRFVHVALAAVAMYALLLGVDCMIDRPWLGEYLYGSVVCQAYVVLLFSWITGRERSLPAWGTRLPAVFLFVYVAHWFVIFALLGPIDALFAGAGDEMQASAAVEAVKDLLRYAGTVALTVTAGMVVMRLRWARRIFSM